jgi:hypothetical protein
MHEGGGEALDRGGDGFRALHASLRVPAFHTVAYLHITDVLGIVLHVQHSIYRRYMS